MIVLERTGEIMMKKNRGIMIGIFILILSATVFAGCRFKDSYEPVSCPVYTFSNMHVLKDRVYRGIGGAYGEELPVKASTFSICGDKIYYTDQIKEDFVVNEERTCSVYCSSLDGKNEEKLVDDAYNLGFGQEKIIGNKLFYPTEPDEEYHARYFCYDLDTKEKQELSSKRINMIFAYDGTSVFYSGYDEKKEKNIVGKYNLKKKKDRILFTFGDVNETGNVISLHYYEGKIYAVTLIREMKDYDARTAEYQMFVYDAGSGKLNRKLPLVFKGSANYGFLYDGEDVYYSTAESVNFVSLREEDSETMKEISKVAELKDREYWGIPHFISEDGFLYYETIADIDEDTGNNDYFYRISLEGGNPELLASWCTL